MGDTENGGPEDRRPTPVRMAMEGSEGEEEKGPELRTFLEPDDGREWVVQVSGRSSSGILPLRVIPLMELAFSRPEEPGSPLRQAICQGEGLDDLQDEDLVKLLRESRPFRQPDLEPRSRGRGRGQKGKPRSGASG